MMERFDQCVWPEEGSFCRLIQGEFCCVAGAEPTAGRLAEGGSEAVLGPRVIRGGGGTHGRADCPPPPTGGPGPRHHPHGWSGNRRPVALGPSRGSHPRAPPTARHVGTTREFVYGTWTRNRENYTLDTGPQCHSSVTCSYSQLWLPTIPENNSIVK